MVAKAGKASYKTAIWMRTFFCGSHTRRTSGDSPATGISTISTPAIVNFVSSLMVLVGGRKPSGPLNCGPPRT